MTDLLNFQYDGMNVRTTLRALRTQGRLSQQQLASTIGTTTAFIAKLKTASALAAALNRHPAAVAR